MSDNIIKMYDITIVSKDVEASKAFFTDLGFPIVHEIAGGLVVFHAGNVDIAIHKEQPSMRAGNGSVGISIIVKDLDSIVEVLKTKQIKYSGPKPIHAGFSGIETQSPDGTGINFFKEK